MIHKISLIFLSLIFSCFQGLVGQNTEIKYLTGKGAEDTLSWDFYCSAGMNSKKWTTIQVPSCWEQQKFGQYNYGHVAFKNRLKETGTYKRNFNVPKDWKSKEVKIIFEGVMTDASVKINGKLAGEVHQGAFYQFDYDITKLLKYGKENKIEVLVKKFSDDKSINMAERKADYWVFGGIFRPIYLEARPRKNIQRVAINAKANGVFEADVLTSNLKKLKIEIDIQTLEGNTVKTITGNANGSLSRISGKYNMPKLWNPETPNLYKAVFKLKSGEKIIHQHIEKFGFRTVELRESDGVYVNGTKIKFKGVNRHTFHPDYARTSSKKLSIEAVELMKEMNMNAVRMSHYPPEKNFLDVCDSLGLFVLDELSGWQAPAYDEKPGRKLLKEMIARDVNHPSIVLWDNGNEGGWNTKLDDDFAMLDIQKREVIHPYQPFGKTNTTHYVHYDYLSLDGFYKRKIFFPTEVLHGLYDGGHGAGLEDYWFRIWNHPMAAGVFLWVFADEGIARTDRNGEIDVDGNHAPDGIVGPRLEKEGSFYTIKKIWSPVFIEKKYITPQFNGILNIENRYSYSNLNECKFAIEWQQYNADGEVRVFSKEKLKTELKPGQKGQLKLSLPSNWQKTHVLKVTAIDKLGKNISTWTYPVQKAKEVASNMNNSKKESNVGVSENESVFEVKVAGMKYVFDQKSGLLITVTKNGKIIPLKDGPVFVSKEKEVEKVISTREADGSISITTIYKKGGDSVIWNVKKNGQLGLAVAYEPAKSTFHAGISFSFPESSISGMKWMGQGPYRVWKNRMEGTNFGVWEKQYNTTVTGYLGLDYPEFKGYHAELYWIDVKTKDATGFRVYAQSDDVFLRMLTPDTAKSVGSTKVKFPVGNISFLHGIDAIGTKFSSTSTKGPQSSKYRYHTYGHDRVKLKMNLLFDFNK